MSEAKRRRCGKEGKEYGEMGKDLGLDMHTDNSDITFNVCLGRDFDGAGLTFCGHMGPV